jgi:hypothetical protein
MKVTSDRIKARANQLRSEGFKLSGRTVRRALELNAGARTQLSSSEAVGQDKAPENQAGEPKKAEAA